MRGLLIRILLTLCVATLAGCAGARGGVSFDNLRYPASMSGLIYGSNDEVLSRDTDLIVVGNFKYKKRFWGILWSAVPLSGEKGIVDALNKEIETAGGEGAVNLSLTASQCEINYLLIIDWIPLMPGCVDVVVEGEIVKAIAKITGYFKAPSSGSDTTMFNPTTQSSKAVAMTVKTGWE